MATPADHSLMTTTPTTLVDNPEEFFIPTTDARRQLGALIDLGISIGLFVGSMAFMGTHQHSDNLLIQVAPMFGWAIDILVYAVPLSLWGWSPGNLLTRRRVVRRLDGSNLSFGVAVQRYFVRRVAGFFLRRAMRQEAFRGAPMYPDRTKSRADAAVGSVVVGSRRKIRWVPKSWAPPIPADNSLTTV
jgi:hypothetical protein